VTERTQKLLLIDSASLYFRAFHGVPDSVVAPDGTPVNAVRGFLDMLAQLVTRFRPTRLVACWDDDWRPAFRVALLPSYKAHRVADPRTNAETVPEALQVQVPVIVEVLAALGLARVGSPGFEADDVIGTLAHAATGPVGTHEGWDGAAIRTEGHLHAGGRVRAARTRLTLPSRPQRPLTATSRSGSAGPAGSRSSKTGSGQSVRTRVTAGATAR
jgi:hypothetical protein